MAELRRLPKGTLRTPWAGVCTNCGEEKPVTPEFFYFRPNGKVFGRQCRACLSAKTAAKKWCDVEAYRARERVRMSDPAKKAAKREADKRSYAKHRDKRLAYETQKRATAEFKKYRAEYDAQRRRDPETREELNTYLSRYHIQRMQDPAKREVAREYGRRYMRENKDARNAAVRNRRARKRNSEGRHTAQDVKTILARQHYRCFWCSSDISGGKHTVDHVHPIARGGSNGPENIVGACAACNYAKGDKLPDDWREYLKLRASH